MAIPTTDFGSLAFILAINGQGAAARRSNVTSAAEQRPGLPPGSSGSSASPSAAGQDAALRSTAGVWGAAVSREG